MKDPVEAVSRALSVRNEDAIPYIVLTVFAGIIILLGLIMNSPFNPTDNAIENYSCSENCSQFDDRS